MESREPQCSARRCKHFIGIKQTGTAEAPSDDVPTCAAFPDGIPDSIAYGTNKHLKPVDGDNGIQFEVLEEE